MRGLILVAALLASSVSASAQNADLVLLNGRIYTLDPSRPWAEAVAISGDRITAVGTTAEIAARRGPSTRVIDLKGRFALPGFNDAHVHIDATGSLLVGANLLEVHTAEPFRQRISEAALRLPKGAWILRGDWGAYEQWGAGTTGSPGSTGSTGSGPFTPSRDLVDAATPEHPVLVNRFDRSMYLANSLALRLAGIDDRTPNPEGGEIVRDARGRATGILKGTAAQLVRTVIPPIPFEQRLTQVRAVLREAREGGVTTMQDLPTGEQLRAYQELHRRGELTSRIMLRPTLDNVDRIGGLGITKGFGDDWLKFIGFKAWVDGIMGSSGAMFFRPYDHDPKNKGALRDIMKPESEAGAADAMREGDHYSSIPPGNLEKLLMASVGTGLTPHVHAIGDKGNRILLDVFERVLYPHDEPIIRDHRWRVIHAQVVHPDDFARFGLMLTIEEAIEAYTKGPAWASFEEDRKGMLKAGYLADIAVFDANLIEIGKTSPAALLKANVDLTIAGGTVVFQR